MTEAIDQTGEEPKKRPASQYYWGDWHRDLALQSCPLAARGLWHEMNCLMHQGEPYGHLTMPNGKLMTPAQLANLTKISERECKKLIDMLEDAGVFSRTPEGGIFSRRMVRDEAVRNARAAGGKAGSEHGIKGAEHGSKGGRPAKGRGVSEPPSEPPSLTPLKPPPSSSSSSSSSKDSPLPPRGDESVPVSKPKGKRRAAALSPEVAELFAEFYAAYPRKVGRKPAEAAFAACEPTRELLDVMLAAIKAQGLAVKMLAGEERFVPYPATWLNQSRWTDEAPVAGTGPGAPEGNARAAVFNRAVA